MDPLVITATVDSTMSYQHNPYCPPVTDVERVAEEYIKCVEAGASITHIHGVHFPEDEIQPDGRKLSKIDFDGWKRVTELIRAKVDPVMQFGIASARLEEKVKLMSLEPELMSYCFTAHDEHFQPYPDEPAFEIYAIHSRDELTEFCTAAMDHDVKVEIESFTTGAFYNMRIISEKGLLPEPIWTTLFLGWGGGQWTPPTPEGLIFLVDNLPSEMAINWNVSNMNPPTHWQNLAQAIIMGGHVRVGWEDNPYLDPVLNPGEYAEHCYLLVEKIARMSRDLGREVATPDQAREIIYGKKK